MKIPKYFRTAFQTYKSTRECIGKGPNGEVVSARDSDGASVAIKVLQPSRVHDEARRGFKTDLWFSVSQTLPFVLKPLDFGNVRIANRDTPFIAMPRFDANLEHWMARRPEERARLAVVGQLLDGVELAHLQGVVHGALKPENVLLDEQHRVSISDWGMRHFEARPGPYSAPELHSEEATPNIRSDIYSLGRLISDLVTAPQVSEEQPETKSLAFVLKLTETMTLEDPEARFGSATEVKKKLLVEQNIQRARDNLAILASTVVPTRELDDPLIQNPIRLTGERDYRDGKLFLKLSQPVTYGWTLSFRSMDAGELGQVVFDHDLRPIEPKSFVFKHDTVYNTIEPDNAQRLVDYLKRCIERANGKYKADMEEAARSCERSEWEALERRIEQERTSVAVIESLNI